MHFKLEPWEAGGLTDKSNGDRKHILELQPGLVPRDVMA